MSKYFNLSSLVLFAFLILFPVMSWYYLRSGFDYRKTQLEALKEKQSVLSDSVMLAFKSQFTDHTTVFDLQKNASLSNQIFDQFKEAKSFQLVTANDVLNPKNLKSLVFTTPERIEQLRSTYKTDFLLIDSDGNLRKKYGTGPDDMQAIVHHLATILPFNDKNKRFNDEK